MTLKANFNAEEWAAEDLTAGRAGLAWCRCSWAVAGEPAIPSVMMALPREKRCCVCRALAIAMLNAFCGFAHIIGWRSAIFAN